MMARRRPRGFVLVVALGLLLALTVGALVAARTTTLELRMARNATDAVRAFHAAEAGLVDAERWLVRNGGDPAATFSAAGTGGLAISPVYGGPPPWRRSEVWTESRVPASLVPGVDRQPRYIIEWLTTLTDTGPEDNPLPPVTMDVFGVTARGSGATADVTVTLQSTFGRATDGSRARRLSWTELP